MIIKESRRSCFYFGEEILLRLAMFNWTPVNQKDCTLLFKLDGKEVERRELPSVGTHSDNIEWRYDSKALRLGQHKLEISLRNNGGIDLKSTFPICIVERPNQNGMANWHWPATVHYDALEASRESALRELDRLRDCGFTWANFRDEWALLHPDDAVFLIEEAMKRGIELGILVENAKGGIFRRRGENDAKCILTREGEVKNLLNPHTAYFREKVTLHTKRLMELFKEFPAVRTMFVNSELEDMLCLACDKKSLAMHEKKLGFPISDLRGVFRTDAFAYTDPKCVKPGVVADDDKEVAYMRYYFTEGDGWSATNRLMAKIAHEYRPDMLVLSDPYRLCPIPERFAGMDAVSSWTYTNPDPKTSLFAETLDCASRHLGNKSVPSITLWNYAGSLFPSGANRFAREFTVRMGPDRWKECAWIYFSRGCAAIGSYFGSPMEIFIEGGDEHIYSHATEGAIASFHREVMEPFGELARSTENTPRQVAVLDCLTARVYGDKEREHTHYANYQIYNFSTLLALCHVGFDVIIEEDVLAGMLVNYKMLVLARADVLSASVFKAICKYAKAGGIVIADRHCRAHIPNMQVFDFDFTHRRGVNANALSTNRDYASKDDKNSVAIVNKTTVKGMTADQDRAIMEAYAAELQAFLQVKLPGNMHCDTPRILLNMRQAGETTYLFAVNDNRTYDKRTSIWKSMEEKGLPISGTVTVDLPYEKPVFRELLSGRTLKARRTQAGWSVRLELPAAGGAIVAISEKGALPKPMASLNIIEAYVQLHIENCGTTLRPFKVEYNGKSQVRCAHGNEADFIFPLAAKEQVPKALAIQDLLTGETL